MVRDDITLYLMSFILVPSFLFSWVETGCWRIMMMDCHIQYSQDLFLCHDSRRIGYDEKSTPQTNKSAIGELHKHGFRTS